MDFMEAIVELISRVGFPIVACGACFWKINDQDKKHQAEVHELTTVVENNTRVIQRLFGIVDNIKEEEV